MENGMQAPELATLASRVWFIEPRPSFRTPMSACKYMLIAVILLSIHNSCQLWESKEAVFGFCSHCHLADLGWEQILSINICWMKRCVDGWMDGWVGQGGPSKQESWGQANQMPLIRHWEAISISAQRTDSGVKLPSSNLSSALYLVYDLGQNI